MRITRNILTFVGALLLVPALAFAAVHTPAQTPKAAAKAAAKAATHSTSGIVQSQTATSLVIAKNAKAAKAAKTETFVLNATTVTKGDVVVGARVGVRYVAEGGQNVATAVTATVKGKGIRPASK